MSMIAKIYRLQKEMRRTFQEAEVGTYASGAAFFLFLSVIPMVMIVSGILPHDLLGKKKWSVSRRLSYRIRSIAFCSALSTAIMVIK